MKKFLLLTATILLSVSLFAQTDEVQTSPKKKKEARHAMTVEQTSMRPQRQGFKKHQDAGIAGLTDEQRNSIKELRLAMEKEVRKNTNLLREKKAHLTTLQDEDKLDQQAINKTIDEITALQGQVMKARAEFRAKMNPLLTEEQRAAFNKHNKQRSAMRTPKKGPAMARAAHSSDASGFTIATRGHFSGMGKNVKVVDKEGKEISDWKSIPPENIKSVHVTKGDGEALIQIEMK